MKLKDLVGYQLVSIDDAKIIVKKGNRKYEIVIIDHPGDCCGYNDIKTELYFDKEDSKRNPVIIDVDEKFDYGNSDTSCSITFIGEYGNLGKIDSLSGSDSGWCYGATVTLISDKLGIKEIISSW